MFEQVFVNPTGRTVRPCAVLASFAGQVIVVAVAILLPLAYTDVLPRTDWMEHVFTMKPPDLAPKPVEPAARSANVVPLQIIGKTLIEPRSIPAKAVAIVDPPSLLESEIAVSTGLPSGLNPNDGIFSQTTAAPGLPAPPSVAPAPPTVRTLPPRVKVGGKVKPPVPISTPKPVYPTLAIQTRISGTVRLEAVIGIDGKVYSLRLVQGHPLLVSAAIDAVKQWRYTPTLLNGEPVELEMQVDVNFQLAR